MRSGQNVNPGNIVECSADELRSVIDKFDVLEADPQPSSKPKVELLIQLRPNTTSWFDVINSVTGKPVNTKSLKKAEAEELAGHPYEPPLKSPRLQMQSNPDRAGHFDIVDTESGDKKILDIPIPEDRALRFLAAYEKLVAQGQAHNEAIENVLTMGDPDSDNGGADEI